MELTNTYEFGWLEKKVVSAPLKSLRKVAVGVIVA
jgi:hypothetical protein